MAFYLFCCFLLHLFFGAVLTGTKKFVYSGMSFKLFENLTFQNHMTLYTNGVEESVLIAIWEVKNAAVTPKNLNPNYTGKIFMEIDKTPFIFICNVDQTLSAKYVVIYDKDTKGPEVELKIVGNLTEDEFHEWLDDQLGFMNKYLGSLTAEQIGPEIRKLLDDHTEHIREYHGNSTTGQIMQIRKLLDDHTKDIKEYVGNSTGEQIRQTKKLQDDHTEHVKEYHDSWNLLFLGLLIAICIILTGIIILLCILANRTLTGEQTMQIKKLLDDRTKDIKEYVGNLTGKQIGQIRDLLDEQTKHIKDHVEKLTEDQICKQIKKREDASPELYAPENDQVVEPTLDELSVTLHHSGTGIEGNPNQSVSMQEMFNASQHADDVNNYQAVIPSLVEPTVTESGNEIEGNQMQMSAGKTFIDSQSSDERQKNDTDRKPTLTDLAVTWCGPVPGTEDNIDQLELSSTGTFSEPGPSCIRPFSKDKQDANPEQDMVQDVRVVIEDSDSDDRCQEPLLEDHVKM